MKIPYRDEIAELRERLDAGQQAAAVLSHLNSAMVALSVIEIQLAAELPVPAELPAEEILHTVATLIPQLAEIHRVGAGARTPAARIHARKQQVQLAIDHVEPMVATLEEIAAEMHTLQHKQSHQLEKPEWSEVVAKLKGLSTRRMELSKALGPVQNQLAHINPVREMLGAFHPQLQAELVEASRTDDPDGRVAWKAGSMAHAQLVGLVDVVHTMGLSIAFPVEPMLPDKPEPRHRRRLRSEAGGVLEWMVKLSQALVHHGDVLQERVDALVLEQERVEAELKEWMG